LSTIFVLIAIIDNGLFTLSTPSSYYVADATIDYGSFTLSSNSVANADENMRAIKELNLFDQIVEGVDTHRLMPKVVENGYLALSALVEADGKLSARDMSKPCITFILQIEGTVFPIVHTTATRNASANTVDIQYQIIISFFNGCMHP